MEKIALNLPGGYKIEGVEGMPTQEGVPFVNDLIQWGVTMLLIGGSLLCLILLVMGGIQWITSGGDKNGIEAARKRIVYALIGLVIIFLSFMIMKFIGNLFGLNLLRFSA